MSGGRWLVSLVAWALVLCVAAASRREYCDRADPAWRAYRAPLAFEGRVRSIAADGTATLQVRRAMKRMDGWPRRDMLVRLKLPTRRDTSCESRFEAPLRIGKNYIVFAEKIGFSAMALGQPLRRTRRLMQRVRDVLKPSYLRAARVQAIRDVRVQEGSVVKLECQATARPPPRITWYKGDIPLTHLYIKRIRVHNYRRRSVLIIRHVRSSDAARYECRAQGAIGPLAIAAANVTVNIPLTSLEAPCPMPDPSSYCLNGGTCLFFEQVREPACKCPEGFNGQRCENKDVSGTGSMYHSYTCKLGLSTSYYC